jgi:hypothetical protein
LNQKKAKKEFNFHIFKLLNFIYNSNYHTNYISIVVFLNGLQTFAATASAGLRASVPVHWHKCLHAGADVREPSETRIGCEPLLCAVFI